MWRAWVAAMCQLGGCSCHSALGTLKNTIECPSSREVCSPGGRPTLLPPGCEQSSREGGRQCAESGCSCVKPPASLPSFPTNLLTLKRGKLMLFLMKRVKFSASRRRAGLGKTVFTQCPSPQVFVCPEELGREQGAGSTELLLQSTLTCGGVGVAMLQMGQGFTGS